MGKGFPGQAKAQTMEKHLGGMGEKACKVGGRVMRLERQEVNGL